MNDAMRDVIIRIRYETIKAKLESPELSAAVKAHEDFSKSAKQHYGGANDAARESARVQTESATVVRAQFQETATRMRGLSGESLEGITSMMRGIALLAANGSQDSQKLLNSIVGIEGGISLVRGALKMLNADPTMGVITAAVTAGAGAWLLYSQQVAKAETQIKAVNKVHREAVLEQERQQASQEKLSREGESRSTDATQSQTERQARQALELEAIRSRRTKDESSATDLESRRVNARRKAEDAESRLNADPGYIASFFSDEGARNRMRVRGQQEIADRERSNEKYFRDKESESLSNAIRDTEREGTIIEEQRQRSAAEVRARESEQIESMRRADAAMNPIQKMIRERDEFYFTQQRDAIASGLQQFGGVGGVAAGGVFGTATSQDFREEGIHSRASKDIQSTNSAFDQLAQTIVAKITTLQKQLNSIPQTQ